MAAPAGRYLAVAARRWLRSTEWALIALALVVGTAAGLLTTGQSWLAHGLQRLFYGVGINRLSALGSIHHPWRLLALPFGGLMLLLLGSAARRWQTPIDVVEANALHGGRIPVSDSLWVSLQTIISNGFGASVGLEAAYAQAGGGFGSMLGQALRLRRGDLRTIAGAGAGAGIAAAFGSPLTGAFYAFEVVIGSYTPASIAPVAAASLAAALVARSLGAAPYLTVAQTARHVTTTEYLLFALLGVICALAGIAIMRLQTTIEQWLARGPLPPLWRPVAGGLLLMPIAWLSPQALSAGHGALRLDIALHPAITFLLLVFALKVIASVISLSFGFRGGLFFASLFLGSLLGPAFAEAVDLITALPLVSDLDASLVGMAALAVAVVGGPMTLSLLVLETTQDFALTGAVVTASLCASALTRSVFGYSFSTWRLHLRGAGVRSPRDVGWARALTAARLMRRDARTVDAAMTIAQFRAAVPLGSTSRVLLRGEDGTYGGLIVTAEAYDPELDPERPLAQIAQLADETVAPSETIDAILDRFEQLGSDDLAVVDADRRILGVLTEKYVHRRYIEESEKAQSRLFGE